MKVTIIAGARPNFMKIAPLMRAIKAAKAAGKNITARLVYTGSDEDKSLEPSLFTDLDMPRPDVYLHVDNTDFFQRMAGILVAFARELEQHPAQVVLVVDDLTPTMACSIVAKKKGIKVAHLVAGTRSFDMDMPKEVNSMIENIEGFRLPRYEQIPNVGLYLEQVVRYVNAHLAPLGESELTSSMVSNYVKQGLIPSPIKKAYTAEHLARLLFIAVVKPVVQLEGLRLMFGIQEDNYPLQTAYDYFCDEFENMLGAAFGIAPARDGIGKTQSDAKDLLRNTILATVNKVYLDRYLEDYQKRREKEIHRQE